MGFFTDTVQVFIDADRLTLKSVGRPLQYSDTPQLMVDGKGRLLRGVGTFTNGAAGPQPDGSHILRPFFDGRVAVTDTDAAGQLLKEFICRLYGRRYFHPSLTLLIHPPAALKNKLTKIETEALLSAAHKAGAQAAYVVTGGGEITEGELKAMKAV